ncbi:T9SS type A sorting domain-containing protein [Paracrocinitomix mangrovi]|uniref:T9SS type A sorting domain-containing protein n=1 Tax=Paracrocinitomix mangrovi TaxID=2862509 RepID=UPI001C8D8BCB|nr:T9SS type A sorting domain-containing protein [Paracrocinitomix mangrovi]UKN00838.1 T9SS type A sorting domain-containing protein [Paracrocinitomix mangrovi]
MRKYLLFFILFPFELFAQVDLSVESVHHRMGVSGNYQKGMEYFYVPDFYAGDVELSAIVTNQGIDTAHNAYISVDVFHNGSFANTHESSPIDLCGGCTDTFYVQNNYIITSYIQNRDFEFEVFSDESDVNLNNNLDSAFIKYESSGNGYQLRRDNDSVYGYLDSIPGVSFDPQCFGNEYDVLHDLKIPRVQVYISDDQNNLNELIFLSIFFKDISDSTWTWGTQTYDYTINQSDLGNWVIIDLFDDFYMCEGQKMLVNACDYVGQVKFGLGQPTDDSTSWGWAWSSQYEPEFSLNQVVLCHPIVVEADCDAGINGVEINDFKIKVLPNPIKDIAQVEFNLSQATNVQLTVSDISGRIYENLEFGHLKQGEQILSLNFKDYLTGVYILTLTTENQSENKRIIVSR